ncbi:MAG TPA: putative metal-dependent hydrolase [Sphingobacteriaceae bacterium]
MESTTEDLLKYPIGQLARKDSCSPDEIESMIATIEKAPDRYNALVKDLTDDDLKKTYRPGSWNIRQLVHHVADIQMLHFLRMKKALTETDYHDVTLIDMDKWALTPDAHDAAIESSLLMFESITRRYVYLLRSLTADQLKISYYHAIRKYSITQEQAIGMSAWHVRHHLEHIKLALK